MKVLGLDQAGLLAWSNSKKNKSLFPHWKFFKATASTYDSFSSNENSQEGILQLYSLDIVNKTSSSKKIGVAKIDDVRFTSLNWSAYGDDNAYPYGLIASGFDEGSVAVWDADAIIQSNPDEDTNGKGLLFVQNVHSVPVQAIGFNPSRKNLLASGGLEVAIHNLEANILDPEVFSPGDNLHEGSPITAVSWNRQVPHILGSASQNGISVVWDLKVNKAIFNFSDSNKHIESRNVSLSWSPEVPTQIAVTYDNAEAPELQIWDLRNPKGPIFSTTQGHTKGIHSLDWCITDPSLIITVGRDDKVCVWDYKAENSNNLVSETLLEEPCSSVLWSPRQPEIYSITSSQGTSAIYSLNDQIDHIPIWLKPPVGARFGFDGRIVAFGDKNKDFCVHEYIVGDLEDRLLKYIVDFEQNFMSFNISPERLCDNRIASSLLSETEKEEWRFIKAIINNNPDDIIKLTGLDKEVLTQQAEAYTNKTYAREPVAETKKAPEPNNFLVPSQEEAEDFFRSFAEQGTTKDTSKELTNKTVETEEEILLSETITKNTNWNAGIEKMIKRNILVGNIEEAVDVALKCGRVAEAILLAYTRGDECFFNTVESYISSSNDSFTKNVIKHLFDEQIDDLVEEYPLEDWKECIALCVTNSNGVNATFRKQMDCLALRFSKVSNHGNALLCYILSQNFLRILETFAFRTEAFQKGSFDHTVFLMRTIEKLVALKFITRNHETNPIVDRFIYELTKSLHAYSRDSLILNLVTINNSQGFECLILQDRILGAFPQYAKLYPAQKFPFRTEVVNIKTQKLRQDHNLQGNMPHTKVPEKGLSNIGHSMQQQQQQQQQQQFGRMPGAKPPGRAGAFNQSIDSSSKQNYLPHNSIQPSLSPVMGAEPNHRPPIPGGLNGPRHSSNVFNPESKKTDAPPSFQRPPINDPTNSRFPLKPNSQAPFTSAQKSDPGQPIPSGFPPRLGEVSNPANNSNFRNPPSNLANSNQSSQIFSAQGLPESSTTSLTASNQFKQASQPKLQSPGVNSFGMPKPLAGPVRASPGGLVAPQNVTAAVQNVETQNETAVADLPPSGNIANHMGDPVNPQTGGPKPTIPGSFKPGLPLMKTGPPSLRAAPPTNTVKMNPNTPMQQEGSFGSEHPQTRNSTEGSFTGSLAGTMNVGKTFGYTVGPSPHGVTGAQPKPQTFRPQTQLGMAPMKTPPKLPTNHGTEPYSGESGMLAVSQLPSYCEPIYNTIINGIRVLEQIDRDPRKKAELDQKMNGLFKILAQESMRKSTLQDLFNLCLALDQQNSTNALAIQQKIAKEDYTANKEWLTSMRRIIMKK